MELTFKVTAAGSLWEARERVISAVEALNVAHATHLRRSLDCGPYSGREEQGIQAAADARKTLEAMGALTSVEIFLVNEIAKEKKAKEPQVPE